MFQSIITKMDIVKSFTDLQRISDEWNPILTKVSTIEAAADNINFSHEDYPDFVEATFETIKKVIIWLEDGVLLNEGYIKQIHKMVMKDKEYLRLGEYRTGDVIVSGKLIPPQPYLIPQMMMSICPVDLYLDDESTIDWYKKFETIHPFEDGNGRVGGIILASISYLNSGKFTVGERKKYQDYV